jgi:hypothetical protein
VTTRIVLFNMCIDMMKRFLNWFHKYWIIMTPKENTFSRIFWQYLLFICTLVQYFRYRTYLVYYFSINNSAGTLENTE